MGGEGVLGEEWGGRERGKRRQKEGRNGKDMEREGSWKRRWKGKVWKKGGWNGVKNGARSTKKEKGERWK